MTRRNHARDRQLNWRRLSAGRRERIIARSIFSGVAMKTLLVCLAALTLPLSLSAQDAKQDKAKANLSRQDARHLRDMGEADMAEVETGKLAAQKASSPEVKKFAQQMVDEHGKGLSEGEALARSKGMQPPSAPSKKHQSALKKLESMSGEEFDQAYMQQM